ncbi:phospholipase/carboxylesterase [Actinopolyspora lacussalsi subsp. righensis]|uniref:Phospholipase/carboxylesterase n=1 Tax=Actinopolyspora righensis TaxID=995060 RepID=A0A1I7BHS6_9ACTN|nr:alpha/beta hydrolase [Actinopolyspora righensis]SFT86724.1 phospholipase/carboxylesterase [Actinopolyspora righensis]
MSTSELPLRHEFTEGDPRSPVLLMLHGTGGTPRDMAPLGYRIDSEAALLSPAGSVSENGVARWFQRYEEGVFDEQDVLRRAGELAEFVERARDHYGIADRGLVAVGFSNGANIAAALTLLRPDVLTEAVLFAAMSPIVDTPRHSLTDTRVWMSNGEHDPMAPMASVNRLVDTLRDRGAEVTTHRHPGGHDITAEALREAADWLRQRH